MQALEVTQKHQPLGVGSTQLVVAVLGAGVDVAGGSVQCDTGL